MLLILISLRSFAKPNETRVGVEESERASVLCLEIKMLGKSARGSFEIHRQRKANFRPIRRIELEKACVMYANKCQHVQQMQHGGVVRRVQFSCQKITGRRRAYVVDVEEVKSEPAEVVGAVVNAHEKVSTYGTVRTYPISRRIHLRMKSSALNE